MKPSYSYGDIDRAADYIRKQSQILPRMGIILGSGLGSLADSVKEPAVIPYSNIPGWPETTVQGHEGRLVIGTWEGRDAAVLQGRVHFYEGYEIDQIVYPVRVLQRLGVEILVVTNAAGAVNPEFAPGELMLIADHINLLGMAGVNPLRGPNDERLGPRFPDMVRAYDGRLRERAKESAAAEGITLREGVYACLAGPSFETPADLRFLRRIGADAVGMSTVPEVIVARHAGIRVLGISAISNKAHLDGSTTTTHTEVLSASRRMVPDLERLLKTLFRKNEL